MIKAIYMAREDGDYDFLAAFAEEHDYDVHHWVGGEAKTLADVLVEEGEEVIVKDFKDLPHLTDVIEGWEDNFEKNLGAIK